MLVLFLGTRQIVATVMPFLSILGKENEEMLFYSFSDDRSSEVLVQWASAATKFEYYFECFIQVFAFSVLHVVILSCLTNTVVSISQWRNRFLDTTSRCGGLWRWLRSSAQKQAKSQPVYETFPALSMFSAQCSALLLHWLHCTHICSISILIKSFKYSDKKAIKPTAV